MDLDGVAAALYGELPERFVAARDAQVKAARSSGDRGLAAEIAALRRPTVSAWVVNQLARHRHDRLAELLDLGVALREAQASLSAAQLRELGEQRRQVVAALARDGRVLAAELGRPVTETVEAEVATTLEAALADPAVADVVREGRLERAASYAGLGDFGPPTAAGAPPRRAAPPAGKRPLRAVTKPDAVAAAEQQLQHAREVLDDAAERRSRAEREAGTADAAERAAATEVRRLREQLDVAQEGAADAAEVKRAAQRRLEAARAAERAAQQQLAKAQQRRDRAR